MNEALDPDIDWNAYYRNEGRAKPGDILCAICGRATSRRLFIEYAEDWTLIVPVNLVPSPYSVPIGPECAKRFPPEYVGSA